MLFQTEGRIYLHEQRGLSTGTGFNSFHTFNYGQYFDESRVPFGGLKVFNEDVLIAGESLNMELLEDSEVMILPLFGGIELKQNTGESEFLSTEQVLIFSGKAGLEYEICNPYPKETISFLQIWFTHSDTFSSQTKLISFNLQNKNQLLCLSKQRDDVFIGQYNGRADGSYQLKNPNNGVFAFAIAGAFEVQNRLLHPKDALALWNFSELENAIVDFEALSNDAILLLLEVPLK
jgi:quercetin 2,3-dioxygenase